MRRRILFPILMATALLAAASCGGSGSAGGGAGGGAGGSVASSGRGTLRLPSLQLLDIASGRTVDLARFQPRGDKALLVWAWAPH